MLQRITRLVFLVAAAAYGLLAQNASGTGGITGTVTDASGAVVPEANVVVENESKGIRRELTTTDAGLFSAPSLVPASGYTVTVTKAGFATWQTKSFEVLVGHV